MREKRHPLCHTHPQQWFRHNKEAAREAARELTQQAQEDGLAYGPVFLCSVTGKRCVCEEGPCVHAKRAKGETE